MEMRHPLRVGPILYPVQSKIYVALLHGRGVAWRSTDRGAVGVAGWSESGPGVSGPRTVAETAGLRAGRADEDRARLGAYPVRGATWIDDRVAHCSAD